MIRFKMVVLLFVMLGRGFGQQLLIPMDFTQTNHLKAYGLAFKAIQAGGKVEWLLNYRGGSFLCPALPTLKELATVKGIAFEETGNTALNDIYSRIEQENMERIILEKAPEIAVYAPDYYQPWDDAVMMALEYAEIPYTRIYDEEVLADKLGKYDWLHLHHEDFTGQFGKFYANYRNADWYKKQKEFLEAKARELGYPSVPALKQGVAWEIRKYVVNGGLLFAMCSATDALDISLAAIGIDIVDVPFDGSPPDPAYAGKLKFENSMAFENYKLYTDPMLYEYSDIDIPPGFAPQIRDPEADYFTLFEFSAKYDPVPCMLVQNHVDAVKGFMGQTTMYNREKIKQGVVILGEIENSNKVKYLHGNYGKGSFTYLGGHDPEDYTHAVGGPPTNLELHPSSPGYRLILNNVLFPAAKKEKTENLRGYMHAKLTVQTHQPVEMIDITAQVNQAVKQAGASGGICVLFVAHTTAAVTINENADPDVKRDIIKEINKIIPFKDNYAHLEGNSAAHIKASLFGSSETLIIENGRLVLGTWQGIYFCEFDGTRNRYVYCKIIPG